MGSLINVWLLIIKPKHWNCPSSCFTSAGQKLWEAQTNMMDWMRCLHWKLLAPYLKIYCLTIQLIIDLNTQIKGCVVVCFVLTTPWNCDIFSSGHQTSSQEVMSYSSLLWHHSHFLSGRGHQLSLNVQITVNNIRINTQHSVGAEPSFVPVTLDEARLRGQRSKVRHWRFKVVMQTGAGLINIH